MATDQNQMVKMALLAGGGYLAWKYFQDKKAAAIIPAGMSPLPNYSVIPGIGTVLAPPVAPLPTYTGAVPTPYGPVIPSQFTSNTQAQQAAGVTQAVRDRMQDMLYRHQYIFNSVAYALALPPSQQDAGMASRIATLRAKDAVLQQEWAGYTGGQSIPDGTLNTTAAKQNYINFLRAHSWCDPLVGVPC